MQMKDRDTSNSYMFITKNWFVKKNIIIFYFYLINSKFANMLVLLLIILQ